VDCTIGSVDLSSGSVVTSRRKHCRVWPAPDGESAVALAEPRSSALSGMGLDLLDERGRREVVVRHTPGFLGSEIAWGPDGRAFAVCFATRRGTTVDVIGAGGRRLARRPGCFPAWLTSGGLVTASGPPGTLEVDRRPFPGARQLGDLLPAPRRGESVHVSAVASGAGRLGVAVVALRRTRTVPASAAIALFSEAGRTEFAGRLESRSLPVIVGVAPDGRGLWYYEATDGMAVVLQAPGWDRFRLPGARWVSWSPSGTFLAAATDQEIRLLDWPSGNEVATIPVDAADVAWAPGPSK